MIKYKNEYRNPFPKVKVEFHWYKMHSQRLLRLHHQSFEKQ